MKKKMLIIIGIIIFLMVIWVGLNQFDQSLNPNAYTIADLPPTSFEKTNGFYLLWGLWQPEGVDVLGEEFMAPLKLLFEPGKRTSKHMKAFDENRHSSYYKLASEATRKIKYPESFEKDWLTVLAPQTAELQKTQQIASVLLKRYRTLIDTPEISDFTCPDITAPTPNLLPLLRTTKLFTAICTAKAMTGNWEEAVADLITQINFSKRLNSGSRPLFTNLIAKATMIIPLQGLVSLLNHPACPSSIYSQVIAALPPLKYEEYGSRSALIYEYLTYAETIDMGIPTKNNDLSGTSKLIISLIFQKNTTKNYFYDLTSKTIAYEAQEPYLWKELPKLELNYLIDSKTSGLFWRLKNVAGKVFFTIGANSNYNLIFKSYRLRMFYEMTRILAELHQNYTPDGKVQDILKGLDSYKTLDPGSGQPYKWNETKKVLYSIGLDKKDEGGLYNPRTSETDVSIPVVLKNKGE